jgi:CheY-like chemotaxis protein
LALQIDPDIIFLDVIMPGTDGWAVLHEIKANDKLSKIPVIMLTLLDQQELGFVLGASDYLAKPVEKEDLLSAVKKYRVGARENHLLIVEDDDATRHVIRRIMAKQGWTIAEAANGRIGLEQVRRQTPRLILLDLMMPEVDGFQFLAELRRNEAWKSIPVVILTAKDLTRRDHERLTGNVESILQKGALTRAELIQEIRKIVALHANEKTRR